MVQQLVIQQRRTAKTKHTCMMTVRQGVVVAVATAALNFLILCTPHSAFVSAPAVAVRSRAHVCKRKTPVMMADGELNQKGNPSLAIALPLSRDQQIGQAQRAVQAAFEDGITRQLLVLSLPLTGATEMDDWPGGVVQMYSAASPMAKSIMQALPTWAADAAADEGEGGEQTKPPPSGSGKRKVIEQIIDSGDSVGLLQSVADDPRDDAYAFVFPAVESLESIQQVDASAKSRLVALINPQWKSVADFGMFAKDPAEKYLAPYAPVYHLQSYIFKGLTCRLLRAYPNPWQLFKVDETMGSREFVTSWEERPSTAELESALFSAYGEPSTRDRIDTAVRLIKESGM